MEDFRVFEVSSLVILSILAFFLYDFDRSHDEGHAAETVPLLILASQDCFTRQSRIRDGNPGVRGCCLGWPELAEATGFELGNTILVAFVPRLQEY